MSLWIGALLKSRSPAPSGAPSGGSAAHARTPTSNRQIPKSAITARKTFGMGGPFARRGHGRHREAGLERQKRRRTPGQSAGRGVVPGHVTEPFATVQMAEG